nr:hypothetical protein [Kibdelosporangium sp. MJ126-NF4]
MRQDHSAESAIVIFCRVPSGGTVAKRPGLPIGGTIHPTGECDHRT